MICEDVKTNIKNCLENNKSVIKVTTLNDIKDNSDITLKIVTTFDDFQFHKNIVNTHRAITSFIYNEEVMYTITTIGYVEKNYICNQYLNHIYNTGELSLLKYCDLLIKEEYKIISLKFNQESLISLENRQLLQNIAKKYIKSNICLNATNFQNGFSKSDIPGYYCIQGDVLYDVYNTLCNITIPQHIQLHQHSPKEREVYKHVYNKDGINLYTIVNQKIKQNTTTNTGVTEIFVKETPLDFYTENNIKKLKKIYYKEIEDILNLQNIIHSTLYQQFLKKVIVHYKYDVDLKIINHINIETIDKTSREYKIIKTIKKQHV